jgi:hypothetical protein
MPTTGTNDARFQKRDLWHLAMVLKTPAYTTARAPIHRVLIRMSPLEPPGNIDWSGPDWTSEKVQMRFERQQERT